MSNENEVNDNIKVVKEKNGDSDNLTDMELLITSGSKEEILEYDRQKIVDSLMRETGMARSTAKQIASKVDKEIKSQNYNTVSTSYIRELIQLELRRRGFTKKVEEYDNIIFPIYNIENIIESFSLNGKPKDVNATISSYVLRDFSLKRVFSSKIRDAHLSGSIHIHGLSKPTSFYQGVTNFEYIKKNGLDIFGKNFFSNQIKNLSNFLGLTSHFAEYLQKHFVGAVGFVYSNVLLAPFFDNEDNIKKDIFHFMSSLSGVNGHDNDNVFVEFGLSWDIPKELKSVPALGPNGKYMVVIEKEDSQGNKKYEKKPLLDKIIRGNKWKPRYIKMLQKEEEDKILNIEVATYSDFEKESKKIASIMTSYNNIENIDCNFLSNIKFVLLINDDGCNDDEVINIINNTLNLDIFFTNNQQKQIRQPCGVSFGLKGKNNSFNNGIENLNKGILQHITINLPQCVYTAHSMSKEVIFERLSEVVTIVAEAHNQKKKYIQKIDSLENMNTNNSMNIIDIDNPQCSIGFVGLNEFIDLILSYNQDIDKNKVDLKLEVLSHIYLEANKYSEEMGLDLMLEESIFNSVNMRFIKIDMKNYPEYAKEAIQGDRRTNKIYYSDSDRLCYDDYVNMNDFINDHIAQQRVVKGHANTLVYLDQLNNSNIKAILDYIASTSCEVCVLAQNFYICSQCSYVYKEQQKVCNNCGNEDFNILAHDGYVYTLVSSWNETKKGEFEDRKTVVLNYK